MSAPIRCTVLFLAVVPALGCAVFAQKPPTPAARLTRDELAAMTPPPGERYFLILYGSDRPTRQPADTHTWATLVTVSGTPGSAEASVIEETISWLPAEMPIKPLNRRVVPGRNYGLHETIRAMLDTKQDIALWGPYEVWHGLAHRFRVQKAFMESGAIGYQCIDSWGEAGRNGNGCDCIHSISDMDPELPRSSYPLFLYGQPATARLVRRIMSSPITIGAPATHDWILPRLGLTDYRIERREYRGRVVSYSP